MAARPCFAPTPMRAGSRRPRGGWRCRSCPRVFIESVARSCGSKRWIPGGEGGLYLRPFMIASETFLGVKPSSDYIFVVIASPVGSYFKGGPEPVSIWASENYTRAASAAPGPSNAAAITPPACARRPKRPPGLRPGRVPRRGRAPLHRRAWRHEHILRVRRRLDLDPAAQHDPGRDHPRFADRLGARPASPCARNAIRSTNGAPMRRAAG